MSEVVKMINVVRIDLMNGEVLYFNCKDVRYDHPELVIIEDDKGVEFGHYLKKNVCGTFQFEVSKDVYDKFVAQMLFPV